MQPVTSVSNGLLAALPRHDRRLVLDRCSAVELSVGEVIHEPGKRVEHAYFPLSSIVTVHVTVDGHDRLEVGMVGNEGFYGATLALGMERSPLRAVVQSAGAAFRIKAADFEELLATCPELRLQINRYIHAIITQLAMTAYCTCHHMLEARVARWLLMTHDRVQSDRFRLTQELLAEMLGVRRSGVSIAAAALQGRRLISYNRGLITVTDRKGLEAAACGCYCSAEDLYRPSFT